MLSMQATGKEFCTSTTLLQDRILVTCRGLAEHTRAQLTCTPHTSQAPCNVSKAFQMEPMYRKHLRPLGHATSVHCTYLQL